MPVDTPQLELAGVRIYAQREGTHVTGRVEFPHLMHDRHGCALDYHSQRPPSEPIESPALLSQRAAQKLALVNRWRDLCARHPKTTRLRHATAVASEAQRAGMARVGARSLQAWAKLLEEGGPAALCDKHHKPPARVPVLSGARANDAVLVCAWWAFRIGNVEAIGTSMMRAAATLLSKGHQLADVVAVIDCYFAYDTDRVRFPFKTFERWAKYEYAKWMVRAAGNADHRSAAWTAKQRRRAAGDPKVVSELRDLPGAGEAPPNLMGPEPARDLAEFLGKLEALGMGQYARMLLDAAHGDLRARAQACATYALWWPALPTDVAQQIADRVCAQAAQRHRVLSTPTSRAHCVAALLDRLRRADLSTLQVAARLPAFDAPSSPVQPPVETAPAEALT